jgi:capsular polysaccharide biosynthesis protein
LQNLLQSVDVNKNLDQERVSILTAPSMSLPANTRALLKLGIALLGGLGLGFGLIYCLERMDDRFTSLTELTEQFQEEIVGQVPRISIGIQGSNRQRSNWATRSTCL